MSGRDVKKGTLEISAKEKHQGCLWELESEKEPREALSSRAPLLLREETWCNACLPWGFGLTPNTRDCKHFSSHRNGRILCLLLWQFLVKGQQQDK